MNRLKHYTAPAIDICMMEPTSKLLTGSDDIQLLDELQNEKVITSEDDIL